jgi:hypothetical protein
MSAKADLGYLDLPPAFSDRYDRAFLLRYLVAVDDLAERLLTRRDLVPGCAAQEIALGVALRYAETLMAREDAGDLEDIRELAMKDIDFEWLYDRKGLALIANEKVQGYLRPANLGFHQWFEPFDGENLPLALTTSKAPPPPRVRRPLTRAARALQ